MDSYNYLPSTPTEQREMMATAAVNTKRDFMMSATSVMKSD